MKKGLCIFILTVTAGLCSILFAFWEVDSGKGNIAVTETVLAGDAAAAEGVLVEIGTHWKGQLLWNTEYQPGRVKEAASSFDFSSQVTKWGYGNQRAWSSSFTSSGEVGSYRDRSTAYVDIDIISTDFGSARVFDEATGNITYGDIYIEKMPWSRLLQAAADQTAADETRTVTLRPRDYYEYYPLTFSVAGGKSYYESFWDDYATEYFKFLIPEDEKFQVTIRKNQEGGILKLECSSTGEGYYPVEISAAGDTGYYFTFYLEGKNKDLEEIQREFGGRYAVYWLPLAEEGDKKPKADIEKMKAAAQLPEDTIPVTMQLDREGQILYLLVLQRERYLLLTYSVKGGELDLIQQLTAYDAAFDANADIDTDLTAESGEERLYFRKMTVQEDGILLTWQDNRFVFIARDGEGYRFWCTGVFPKSAKGEEDKEYEDVKAWLAHGGYLASESTFPYEHAFAFDGSRLVLAAFERWNSLDSRLLVYREGQLVYSGYYQYSGELDAALGMDDRILPWGDNFGGLRRDGPMFSVLKPLRVSIAP